MSQTLVQNYLHIVFSTKHRKPWIDKEIAEPLYGYIGAICNELDCTVVKVGGYYDHVHILIRLSKNIALTKLMTEVKANSSKWIKTQGSKYAGFYWQSGYGAFAVEPKRVDSLIQYISNQHEHHANKTFQIEFTDTLHYNHVEYDDKYLWE